VLLGERENDIGTLDEETDPFKAGRIPHPFAACIYFSDNDYALLWETDSKRQFVDRIVSALKRLPRCTLYAHNGGRFDFHYLVEFAEREHIQVQNGRIMQMRIGQVTLKDSFPLMPFALEEYKKTKIDYKIFERSRRDMPHNRRKIESYLLDDCRYLRDLVIGFRRVVGAKDTIGSAAFSQMRKMGIQIATTTEAHDDMFRPYYFGGRVQAFEKGLFSIRKNDLYFARAAQVNVKEIQHIPRMTYYDINSAYPDAMRSRHAHGSEYAQSAKLPPVRLLGNCFVQVVADSRGALPLRADDGSLSFPHGAHEFCATGWEILAGLQTRTLKIIKVLNVWIPKNFICFREYVEHFFALRQKAKAAGDAVRRLAYKYLLNSGYGKFATNPREFRDYCLAPFGENVPGYEWETDFGAVSLWSRSSFDGFGFYDVATGASITGFVRAKLWRAICAARRVLYVDTDAMLCQATRITMGGALGEWKREGVVRRSALAGKKLYGVEWDNPKEHEGQQHKIASKGARLKWRDILSLCGGKEILWKNDAPTFSIGGAHFITRRIRAT
jgi:hypothetical protein